MPGARFKGPGDLSVVSPVSCVYIIILFHRIKTTDCRYFSQQNVAQLVRVVENGRTEGIYAG